MVNNKKNYKLLNNKRNQGMQERDDDDDDENQDHQNYHLGDSSEIPLTINYNNNNSNNNNSILNESNDIIEIEDEDEINRIENEEEEDNNREVNNNGFFQKMKNNISSSIKKYKDMYTNGNNNGDEELDEASNINYSYYLNNSDIQRREQQEEEQEDEELDEETSETQILQPNIPNTITITTALTNTINNNSNETQITQVPLYSVNTTPTWFIRANDPYSLESHIINHMRQNNRFDALQEQLHPDRPTTAIDNGNESFRTYSSNFLQEIQEISNHQNNLIKDNDIIIIQQPNNKLSIGFSENKFTSYHKTGEHNPSGYFSPNDELIQRISTQYNREFNSLQSPTFRDDHSDNFSDYGVRLSFYELEKRKKLFLSILSVEIFYYCLLLTSFTKFNPLIIFLLLGLVNNMLALISIKKQNVIALSIFLCIEILMIAFNYFTDLTTLFILRVILFMIAYKLRQEMIIFQSYPNFQVYN